jgi:phage-related protein
MAAGTRLATGWLELLVSTAGAQKSITDEIVPTADRAGAEGGRRMGAGLVAGLAAVAVAGAAAAGIGKIFSVGFDEVKDAAAGTAQLAAGIASTGNAANVSVGDLNSLAASIQGYSGQTDDSITAAQGLLLTFTNIKNVGPDKIFDDATRAAADMAARMGGDAASKATMLGKALNDPVKGVTALTKVGVQFTEQQKEQISAMVTAGDTLGAQKVILGELNTQFGGSAAAFGQTLPGKIEILKRSFEDFSQTAVGAITPIAGPILGLLITGLEKLTPAMAPIASGIADFFGGIGATVGPAFASIGATLGPIFASIGAAIGPIFAQLGPTFAELGSVFSPLIPQFLEFAAAVSPTGIVLQALAPVIPQLVGVLGQLAGIVGGALATVFTTLAPVITQLAGILTGVLSQAFVVLVPIIAQIAEVLGGALGATITALVPVIGLIATTLGTVLGTVIQALVPVIAAVTPIFSSIITAVAPLVGILVPLIAAILELVAPLVQLVGAILGPLIQLFGALLTPIIGLIAPLVGLLVPVLQFVVTVLTFLVAGIVDVISWIVNLITGSGDAGAQLAAIWNQTMGMFSDFFSNTIGMVSDFIGNTVGMFIDFGANVGTAVSNLWSGVTSFFSNGINGIVSFFTGLPGQVLAAIGDLGSTLFTAGQDLINGLLEGAGSLLADIGSFFLNAVPDFIKEPFKLALGIHSPSTVFAGYGGNIVDGLVGGVRAGQSTVDAAMANLVTVPNVGAAAYGGYGVMSGQGGAPITQTTNIYPQETDPVVLGKITGRVIVDQLAGM